MFPDLVYASCGLNKDWKIACSDAGRDDVKSSTISLEGTFITNRNEDGTPVDPDRPGSMKAKADKDMMATCKVITNDDETRAMMECRNVRIGEEGGSCLLAPWYGTHVEFPANDFHGTIPFAGSKNVGILSSMKYCKA
jgi:hypothetical protein